ncbi:hypothetical protein EV356DRAFT_464035 [Viridothelium virens]|uniref:Zn(2)-C6 fungal-type domain-containing protein n=1 Tax=Viridothelium virens TaxID=1048519 RepID=A0A6A6HDS1_VIRVR|nr:hypothetical protein EV356DRAFT_464035 [Viridothelium virens]
MNSEEPTGPRATQACVSCRRQKRKCDKVLPECGLCRRIGRPCDYEVGPPHSVDRDDFDSLQQKVLDLEARLAQSTASNNGFENGARNGFGSSNAAVSPSALSSSAFASPPRFASVNNGLKAPSPFPSLFFLDANTFEQGRYTVQKPHMTIPPEVLEHLGDSTATSELLDRYFATTHTWMPIVSKMRISQTLANPLMDRGADMAMLFLAMKLLTQTPSSLTQKSQTALYQTAKSFLAAIEYQNMYSIHVIQATLLIAAYELGNAIYPTAYLTIGHCARLGHAMGLHHPKSGPQMLPRCTTWTEQEERRRVWWAVVVLDRFVNIGNPHHPFASEDPSLETYLPVDDDTWDKGEMTANELLLVSTSPSVRAAPFARTCQASHLLGKVLHHINDVDMELDFRFEQANQLNRTVRALANLLPDEAFEEDVTNGPTLCTAMAICYSALLVLYEAYVCTEGIPKKTAAHVEIQESAINGLKEISGEVLRFCKRIKSFLDLNGLVKLSPFVADCLYQAAANYAWYVKESENPESLAMLQEIKSILVMIEPQWKVAGEYLRIVEATEFNYAGSS